MLLKFTIKDRAAREALISANKKWTDSSDEEREAASAASGYITFLRLLRGRKISAPLVKLDETAREFHYGLGVSQLEYEAEAVRTKQTVRRVKKVVHAPRAKEGKEGQPQPAAAAKVKFFDGWAPFDQERDAGYVFDAATRLVLLNSILEQISVRWKKREDSKASGGVVDYKGIKEDWGKKLTWKKLLSELQIEEPLPVHDVRSRERLDEKWYCCPFRLVCSRARTLELRPFGSESEGKAVTLRVASADDAADVLRRLQRAPAARRAGRAKECVEFELIDENDDVIPPSTRVSEIRRRSGVRYRALRSARKGHPPPARWSSESANCACWELSCLRALCALAVCSPSLWRTLCCCCCALCNGQRARDEAAEEREERERDEAAETEEDALFARTRSMCCGNARGETCVPLRFASGGPPLDSIQQEHGAYIAMYFAWEQLYCRWLFVPAVVGLAVFFFQLVYRSVDQPLLPFFALFINVWLCTLPVAWRAREKELAERWGVLNYERNEEAVLVEYKSKQTRNRVTGEEETTAKHPGRDSFCRCLSWSGLLGVTCVCLVFTLGLPLLRDVGWPTALCEALLVPMEGDGGGSDFASVNATALRLGLVARDSSSGGGGGSESELDIEQIEQIANLEASPLSMVETEEGLLGQLQLLLSGKTLSDEERRRAWGYALWYVGVPFVLFSLAIPIIDALVERCSQSGWIRALENHKTETKRRAHRIYKVFFFRFANGVFPLLVESFGARLIQLYGYGSNLTSGDQLAQQQDDALIALWLQLLSCVLVRHDSVVDTRARARAGGAHMCVSVQLHSSDHISFHIPIASDRASFMVGQLVMNTLVKWQLSSWSKPLTAKAKSKSARCVSCFKCAWLKANEAVPTSKDEAAAKERGGGAKRLPGLSCSLLYFACSRSMRRDLRAAFCVCSDCRTTRAPKCRGGGDVEMQSIGGGGGSGGGGGGGSESERGAQENAASQWALEVFDDFASFSESMMQLGYVTFFSPVFPLAPVLALVTNMIGLRLKGHRLLFLQRRPVPRRASGIGVWNDCIACVRRCCLCHTLAPARTSPLR